MAKKKTLPKLKKDLWKVFALYIKLKYSNDNEKVKCFTCNQILTIGQANCQAGHCLPKGGYPTLYFHENNVRPQCYRCNVHLSGNTAVFIENLKAEIGEERYLKMYDSRHEPNKPMRSDYEYLIDYYKDKIIDL